MGTTGTCYPLPDALTISACNAENGDLEMTIKFQEPKIKFSDIFTVFFIYGTVFLLFFKLYLFLYTEIGGAKSESEQLIQCRLSFY